MICNLRHLLVLLLTCVTAMVVLSLPREAAAQKTSGQQEAIDSAREELGSGANPWFDPELDSLRKVKVERVTRSGPLPFGWLLKWIVYGILAVVIVAIIYALIRFAMEQLKSRKLSVEDDNSQPLVDEAEALPFLAERPRGDLLGLARQHYEQGNYSEAIIYLFSYELVELDRGSRIHLAKGKTNRQYLRELNNAGPLRGALERTLLAFEGVFFGRRSLDRAGFEACWHELPQFQAQLRGAT
jgi:hypothetical protein